MSEETSNTKLFIGGLSLGTTKDSLQEYFEKYGELVDVVVMRDGATKRSRGFGFVTYAELKSMEDCLADGNHHSVDGRDVEVKRAVPREATPSNAPESPKVKKVFLGGLSLDTSADDIRNVLEAEFEVAEIIIMREKVTEKPRGFGFAILDNFDDVERLCSKKYIKIKDRDVEVKKAISQEEMKRVDTTRPRSGGQQGGYHGGRDHGSYGSARDPYTPYGYARTGGMYPPGVASGYEYQYHRDYTRPDAAYWTGGYDRNTAYAYAANSYAGRGGYDMSAAAYGLYGGATGMGAGAAAAYSQTASTYSPSRGYGGSAVSGSEYGKDRGGTSRQQSYHPYRRTQ